MTAIKVLELMNEIQRRYPKERHWSILRRLLEQQQAVEEATQQNAQADDGWCHCPPPLPTTGIDELEFCNGCQRPRR